MSRKEPLEEASILIFLYLRVRYVDSVELMVQEKPDIIILDEPFNAIDIKGVEAVKDIIIEEKKHGATIILASHSKDTYEELVDMNVYISEGRIVEIT